jgi:hypothetical protein
MTLQPKLIAAKERKERREINPLRSWCSFAAKICAGCPLLQLLSNPSWIATAVQDRPDTNHLRLDGIIDRVRKALGEKPMKPKDLWVDASLQPEGINL